MGALDGREYPNKGPAKGLQSEDFGLLTNLYAQDDPVLDKCVCAVLYHMHQCYWVKAAWEHRANRNTQIKISPKGFRVRIFRAFD